MSKKLTKAKKKELFEEVKNKYNGVKNQIIDEPRSSLPSKSEFQEKTREHDGSGGHLQLRRDLFYNKKGKPLNDDEWKNMIYLLKEKQSDEWLQRFENRRFERFKLNHKHKLEKQQEDRIDVRNQRHYDLVRMGLLNLKNGKYYTNDERVKEFLNDEHKRSKKNARDEFIKKEGERKARSHTSRLAIPLTRRLLKLFERKAARQYDRHEKRNLKKEYKMNAYQRKLEKKYGKIIRKY